jgi:hypothetical protein
LSGRRVRSRRTTGTFVSGGSTVDWRGVQACTAKSGTNIFRFGNTPCTTDYGNGRFTFANMEPARSATIALTCITTVAIVGE